MVARSNPDSHSLGSPSVRIPKHSSEILIRLDFILSDQHESRLLEDRIKVAGDDPG